MEQENVYDYGMNEFDGANLMFPDNQLGMEPEYLKPKVPRINTNY